MSSISRVCVALRTRRRRVHGRIVRRIWRMRRWGRPGGLRWRRYALGVHWRLRRTVGGRRRLRIGIVLRDRQIATAGRHGSVRVGQLRHRVGGRRGAGGRRRTRTLIIRVLRVSSRRRWSTARTGVVTGDRLRTRRVRVVVAPRRARSSAVRRWYGPGWILLVGSVSAAR